MWLPGGGWGGGAGSGMDREIVVNGRKVLLLEWIGNEILLFSTENYLITYDGA